MALSAALLHQWYIADPSTSGLVGDKRDGPLFHEASALLEPPISAGYASDCRQASYLCRLHLDSLRHDL